MLLGLLLGLGRLVVLFGASSAIVLLRFHGLYFLFRLRGFHLLLGLNGALGSLAGLVHLYSAVRMSLHMSMDVPDRGVPVSVVADVMPAMVTAMDGARMVLSVALRMGVFLGLALDGVSGGCIVPAAGPGRGRLVLRDGASLSACCGCRGIGLLRGVRRGRGGFAGAGGLDLSFGLNGSGGRGLFGCKSAASGESNRKQTHKSDN